MNKPYRIVQALSKEQIDEIISTIKERGVGPRRAKISNGDGKNVREDNEYRSCLVSDIQPSRIDLDAHLTLLEFVDNSSLYFIDEWHYLQYAKGDHFIKHRDTGDDSLKDDRVWTMITLINKSDDLVGGELLVYISEHEKEAVNLQVGDTVILSSDTYHEVSMVESGTREVLVNWLRWRK